MIEPERNRHLHALMSVFDLRIHRAAHLEQGVSARILYVYDKGGNIRRFKVLNRNLPQEVHARITLWLEENGPDHGVISALVSNEMDADTLPAPSSAHSTKAL